MFTVARPSSPPVIDRQSQRRQQTSRLVRLQAEWTIMKSIEAAHSPPEEGPPKVPQVLCRNSEMLLVASCGRHATNYARLCPISKSAIVSIVIGSRKCVRGDCCRHWAQVRDWRHQAKRKSVSLSISSPKLMKLLYSAARQVRRRRQLESTSADRICNANLLTGPNRKTLLAPCL